MNEILNYKLFQVGSFEPTVGSLTGVLMLIIGVAILLKIFHKSIYSYSTIDEAKKYSVYTLVKYFTYVLAFVVSLQIIGIDVSILVAGSAALLVGLGLGIQNLFSDYISGIIILFDSSIKVGDVIDVNGLICKVKEINLRNTMVLTRDDKYILLPNTDLTRNQLINWTHIDVNSRFEIKVGVDYSSDVHKVMELMKTAAKQNADVLEQPEPFVRFSDYGESSLDFELFFWVKDVFRVENIKSDLRIKIFELFKANKVEIPFPQRVIHTKV